MVDKVIKLVRPCITGLFAGAVVYFTAVKILPVEVFEVIAVAAIIWWYKDREAAKARKVNDKPES